MEYIFELENFGISFLRYSGKKFEKEKLRIVHNLDLRVKEGELLSVIGSSGAGKSLMAHAALGLLPRNAEATGRMLFKQKEYDFIAARKLRGRNITLIPQSVSFLNPLKTAGAIISRSAVLAGYTKQEASAKTLQALRLFGLNADVASLYPFQLSGGMARRVLVAASWISDADLFLADEPTTGLDAEVAEESLALLKVLTTRGKTVILITHDLQAALKITDRIAVFYGGTIVETTDSECFRKPELLRHPYSQALCAAMPEHDFSGLPGMNPFGKDIPVGCVFAPRCKQSKSICHESAPQDKVHAYGKSRCHYA
jgi:peptide/nickel transport system ATP-binding protein